MFDILGPHSHPSAPIDVKFCTAKRTQVPVSPAKFDRNRCNESPLRGEKPDFWPVSKNNTGSLPLRGILPVIIKRKRRNRRRTFAHTAQCICVGTLAAFTALQTPKKHSTQVGQIASSVNSQLSIRQRRRLCVRAGLCACVCCVHVTAGKFNKLRS